MNADDLIESYVADVAQQLPRKQRDDVAFELRALLREELDAKAGASGKAADETMATELLQAFGPPAEVAARYRPALTIIDPADGHAFLQATWIGLATIWGLGLIASYQQAGSDWLLVLGRWWTGAVIPSLWWPGVLVVSFGIGSWARRRWPRAAAWKPRSRDRIRGGRPVMVLALFGAIAGLVAIYEPRWVLDVFFGGRAAPAAYEALTYTDSFRERQGPWLLALVMLNIPMFVAAISTGRKSAVMRRVEMELDLVLCIVMAWTIAGGPVFRSEHTNEVVRPLLWFVIAISLIGTAMDLRRNVKPAPRQAL